MSKSLRVLALYLTVFASSAAAYAEETPSCRERCAIDYTDCMKSIESATPDARVILEKSCQVEDTACSTDCDEMRSLAGILRKLSE